MENRIEKNLKSLSELQELDNRLDALLEVKGELPQQVKELAEVLAEHEANVLACQQEQKRIEGHIASLRIKLADIQNIIKRLESQQPSIRNSREYDAISKEIKLNELDIQLGEKEIRENNHLLETQKQKLGQLEQAVLETRQYMLEKKQEMEILLGNDKEEVALKKQYESIILNLDPVLFQLYQKIRQRVHNRLAVVDVKRGACGGCFTAVYPQMQAEIKEKKLQIFRCENCGRILADVEEAITIIAPVEEETTLE